MSSAPWATTQKWRSNSFSFYCNTSDRRRSPKRARTQSSAAQTFTSCTFTHWPDVALGASRIGSAWFNTESCLCPVIPRRKVWGLALSQCPEPAGEARLTVKDQTTARGSLTHSLQHNISSPTVLLGVDSFWKCMWFCLLVSFITWGLSVFVYNKFGFLYYDLD